MIALSQTLQKAFLESAR